ncbi:MAG: hypothetical protein QOG54_1033 [Actinomycetota bacterium]|jgi:hypothetical protein|nr:hypothetical protein [Actinomycetota bacterium]
MLPLYGNEIQRAHAEDLMAEAARYRIASARRRERSTRVRVRLGWALVSAGTRIGGAAVHH